MVLAADYNPETAYNLVEITRINQIAKSSLNDFERSEVLVCNFGNWENKTRSHLVYSRLLSLRLCRTL